MSENEKLIVEVRKFRRYNFLLQDEKHYVCESNHHRSADCEWRLLLPDDVTGMLDLLGALCDGLEAEMERSHGFARAVDHEMGRVIEREKEIARLRQKFGIEPEIWTSVLNCVREVSDGDGGDGVHPLARVYVFGARHMAEENRDG